MSRSQKGSQSGSRVTIREVAERAGVSVTTVSHALRGFARVPASTRSKVEEAAEALGYRPNPVFRAVGAQHRRSGQHAAGLPLAWLRREMTVNDRPWGPDVTIYPEATLHARALGYDLQILDPIPDCAPEELARVLYARGYAGAIIGIGLRRDWIERVDWSRLAVVAMGYNEAATAFDRVSFSVFRSMLMLVRQIHALGYRRIGYLGPVPPGQTDLQEDDLARYGGFEAALFSLPEQKRLEPYLRHDRDMDAIRDWTARTKPDCLIGWDYHDVRRLKEAGLPIGKAIGLALQGGVPPQLKDDPDLAGAVKSPALWGRTAVELLNKKIVTGQFGPSADPLETLIEAAWKPGRLLPPRSELRG